MRTTLLIPVLNEAEAMRQILPKIPAGCCDQILVVDGGSVDGSADYARSLGFDVMVQKEKGLRAAYFESIDRVTGDYVILFSPDGNSLPEKIPELVAKLKEGYDMVIVSRYLGPAHSDDDDAVTAAGNWMFTRMINLFFGGSYTDAMVIFRGFRKDIIERLRILEPLSFMDWAEKVMKTLSGWEPQISIRCAKAKLRVCEISGDEPKRIAGKRKMLPWRSGAILCVLMVYEFFFGPSFRLSQKRVS